MLNTGQKLFSRFTQVTLFSKCLAAVLFVALPFVGGWIGYAYGQLHQVILSVPPPPLAVEEATSVLGEPSAPPRADTGGLRSESYAELYTLYESSLTEKSYSLMVSTKAPRVLGYDPSVNGYFDPGIHIDVMSGESSSPSGRFIVKIRDQLTTPWVLDVIDLETETVRQSIEVPLNELLVGAECADVAPVIYHSWVSSSTLRYTISDLDPAMTDRCYGAFEEAREVELR